MQLIKYITLAKLGCAAGVLLATASATVGQSLPASQPNLITIFREKLKTGHAAAHVKTEAGWPAAFAKAKSTDYYLALSSITGEDEVWFVAPWESYAAWGKAMNRDQSDPKLREALERLMYADAAHVETVAQIEARARPELGHGAYPDLNKARFWEISQMKVRPGHDVTFAAAAKAYQSMAERGEFPFGWRVYQVSAGAAGGTYFVFMSVDRFEQFDEMASAGRKMFGGSTPEEQAALRKFELEGMISIEVNRYRLDPDMSFVADEVKAADPGFWSKKTQK